MFIEIKKITSQVVKTDSGEVVKHPGTNKPVSGPSKVVSECIEKAEIRSFRPWHKSATETIKGDITLIYMKGNAKKSSEGKQAEIMIQENYLDFAKRLGTTMCDDKE